MLPEFQVPLFPPSTRGGRERLIPRVFASALGAISLWGDGQEHAAKLPAKLDALLINGHPDPSPERFCSALCDAFARGMQKRHRQFQRLNVAELSFTRENNDRGAWPDDLARDVQDALTAMEVARRIVVVYPLRLDHPPAALLRLFAQSIDARNLRQLGVSGRRLKARRLQQIITMDLPAFAHRCKADSKCATAGFRSRSLPGVRHDSRVFIGSVKQISRERRERWLQEIEALAADAS